MLFRGHPNCYFHFVLSAAGSCYIFLWVSRPRQTLGGHSLHMFQTFLLILFNVICRTQCSWSFSYFSVLSYPSSKVWGATDFWCSCIRSIHVPRPQIMTETILCGVIEFLNTAERRLSERQSSETSNIRTHIFFVLRPNNEKSAITSRNKVLCHFY